MKTFILKLKRHMPRASILRSLVFVLGFGYVGFAYASLFPGPLTGHQVDGDPIGGYVSHAQFERGCTHCHAPLHCVTEDRCQECHVDVAQERAEMSGMHGLLPGTNRCQNCHVEHQGREADITTLAFRRIDHATLANFSLDYHQEDYAGQAMDCQSCHSQDDYRQVSLDCVTCHAEQDHDLMASHIDEHGMECLACHDGKTRLADFEHNVQAFNLTGAHTEVECKECHNDPKMHYNDTPTACVNCHTEEERPESHPAFGDDCARCHETTAFAPARLTQHTFELGHAGIGEQECQTCHNHSYDQVNCMGCHTEGGRIEAIHQVQLGIIEMEECASCHPTGLSGETNRTRVMPAKAGEPPADAGSEAGGSAEPQATTLPFLARPTFSSKGDSETAPKATPNNQEGNASQP
jgi:hypothetical protein